jgi:hypothetical protein
MTLESSGTLYLVGSSSAPTRSIQFELEGAYTGIGLLEAIALSGESYNSMTDFYGYSACSDPTPGNIASVTGSDQGFFARCTYTTSSNADNYRVQYAISPFTSWNPTSGGGAFDAASPYTTTLANGTWRFRVCGENCSGLGPYTQSSSFVMS